MRVTLTKEEVVKAIKEYVSNKLSHEVASVDDQFISGASVELGEPKSDNITLDGLNVTGKWTPPYYPTITPLTSPWDDGVSCNLASMPNPLDDKEEE